MVRLSAGSTSGGSDTSNSINGADGGSADAIWSTRVAPHNGPTGAGHSRIQVWQFDHAWGPLGVEELTSALGLSCRLLDVRHVTRIEQQHEPRARKRRLRTGGHPRIDELVPSAVNQQRGDVDVRGLPPQPAWPALHIRRHDGPQRGAVHRLAVHQLGAAAQRLPVRACADRRSPRQGRRSTAHKFVGPCVRDRHEGRFAPATARAAGRARPSTGCSKTAGADQASPVRSA